MHTVTTRSCTASRRYWSSSTVADNDPAFAWTVNLVGFGDVWPNRKLFDFQGQPFAVQAVRGGL